MKYTIVLGVLGIAIVALSGCSKGAVTADGAAGRSEKKPAAAKAESKLIGKYKGEPHLDKNATSEEKAQAAMATSMLDALGGVTLELLEAGKFKMVMLGIDMTGDWRQNGNNLTLTVAKVMGLEPKEFMKQGAKTASGATVNTTQDLTKPMRIEVQKDSNLMLIDEAKVHGKSNNLLFKRQA